MFVGQTSKNIQSLSYQNLKPPENSDLIFILVAHKEFLNFER